MILALYKVGETFMKALLLMTSLLFASLAQANSVQLNHGQTAFHGRHQVLCTSPAQESNACFVQVLRNKKIGIVLPDGEVIVKGQNWAFLNEMKSLYNQGTCNDFYRYTIAKKSVMPAGSKLSFKNKVFRCPSAARVTRKNCQLINQKDGFDIVTPGGLLIPGGALETTKVKLRSLMRTGICNDVSEV
jgi:hypothetical protein